MISSNHERRHQCHMHHERAGCIEVDGDLWIKSYDAIFKNERNFLVFYCPWCGYQTENGKYRCKNEKS